MPVTPQLCYQRSKTWRVLTLSRVSRARLSTFVLCLVFGWAARSGLWADSTSGRVKFLTKRSFCLIRDFVRAVSAQRGTAAPPQADCCTLWVHESAGISEFDGGRAIRSWKSGNSDVRRHLRGGGATCWWCSITFGRALVAPELIGAINAVRCMPLEPGCERSESLLSLTAPFSRRRTGLA